MARHVADMKLLGHDDPASFTVYNPNGSSPFVLVADHAGQQIPSQLGDLGLPQAELDRHIGWDIGIAGVTEQLAGLLDAFAILQTYSRLVIDCNRPLDSASSIVGSSDGILVPGNQGLQEHQRTARALEIFAPYHGRITQELDKRSVQPQAPVLIAMQRFTQVFAGETGPWHVGVLYYRETPPAHTLSLLHFLM